MDYRNPVALSQEERQNILDLAEALNTRNRLKRQENELARARRVTAAKNETDRLVKSFRSTDPKLQRIVLFGSLARGNVKRLKFDIDLAVESSRYMDLLEIALDSEFKIDLIDLTTASRYIRRSVNREGAELFRAE